MDISIASTMKKLATSFILFGLIYCEEYNFKNYAVASGLSESTVNVIYEDSKGFIYIGTENGLGVFDGISFFNYKMNVFDDFTILGNNIKSIYEDSNKNIWVGTELGISVLNTRQRKFKRIDQGKFDLENVERIFSDKKGKIWFKCPSGIYFYSPSDNEIICVSCGDNIEINSFSNIFHTSSQDIFISTFSNIFKYNSSKDTLISIINKNYKQDINISFVTDVIELNDEVWVASKNGLIKIPNDIESEPKEFISRFGQNSLVNDDIRDIEYSSLKNEIWIATKGGISIFDLELNQFKNIKVTRFANSIIENEIKKILIAEKSNRVWFTTTNYGGINSISFEKNEKNSLDTIFVNLQHDEIDKNSIPDNNITTFIEDRTGNVWFGTANNGLSLNSAFSSKFSSIKYDSENQWGLQRSKIYSIEYTENNFLWVATDYGLEYISSSGIRYDDISKTELSTAQITDIFYQDNNTLWVGTVNGLIKVNLKTRSLNRYTSNSENEKTKISDNVIYDIYNDNDGNLWVSTRKGVSIIALNSLEVVNYPMDDPIRFVYKDYHRDIWFSTVSNGLFRAKKEQEKSIFRTQKIRFDHYKFDKENTKGVSSSKITCISQIDSNFIWFGSTNGGLNKFNKKKNTFEHFFIENGLPSNYITGIHHSSNQNLWISSKNGISNFNLQNDEILNYNLYDGLSDLDFFRNSVSVGETGNIFFGGPNGLTIIEPGDIKLNTYKPPCLITNLKRTYFDGSSKNIYLDISDNLLDDQIIINHNVKSITIEFVALNYHQPKKNRYKYILENFDNKWTELESTRKVTFNNLGRGDYIFTVMGSNNDNLWSDESSLRLSFVPHPLLSYYAFIIYFILLFGTIYRGLLYKNKQNLERKELEEHKKELEKARDFQLSLIPTSPPKEIDYDITAHMRTSMEVGGDYYDYFKYNDTLFVVCGDASGHGLNAGMMVSITKAGLFGLRLHRPEESLRQLNKAIKAIDLGKMRMSLNIAKFDEGKVSFSSAGMPPAYFFDSQKNKTKEILVPGLPLGSVNNADYDLIDFNMNQNDVLVLISDGLPECLAPNGEMLDYKAVEKCIDNYGDKSSKEIVDELIKLGDDWMGEGMNDDDITIVVIKKI